jgi:hypothetical protein
MPDSISSALSATDRIRRSSGYRALPSAERSALDRDLARIEQALRAPATARSHSALRSGFADPYDVPFETPNDLIGLDGHPATGGAPPPTGAAPAPVPAAPPAARPPAGPEVLGERARRALDAVDFPSFVAGLIQGTFQAIVDATAQQVREYAKLVADLSKTIDEFTRDNVSPNQARDWLAQKYPGELAVALPKPGEAQSPRLLPRDGGDASPAWLTDWNLEGEELTPELTEGPLLEAGRRAVGEERMRLLANMVLLGINRIVVDDGQLRARLQFHASAREKLDAEVLGQTGATQLGIAARQTGSASQVTTLVSTVNVNAQADVSIKADLVGEVSLRFRTQTFDLQRFADPGMIAAISRHTAAAASPGAPAPSAPTPPAPSAASPAATTSGGTS